MAAAPKVRGGRTRAEQRAATVKLILDISEDLFSRLGYFGVTIKDVADKMGIHAALIHYYFDGKRFSCITLGDKRYGSMEAPARKPCGPE